jgi:DNA processing protein
MNDPDLIVLACLPAMSPLRLRHVLRHHAPDDAFERLRRGAPLSAMAERHISTEGVAALQSQAASASVRDAVGRCSESGISVVDARDEGWPSIFENDPEAPVALFIRGDLTSLSARRVGIVGTRNATAAGRASAHELGRDLARAGVTVVSGLARGIDGAAHNGVRSAGDQDSEVVGRAVAVVGSGLDVPYPFRHRDLWNWVGRTGLLISEHAPGVTPEPWHFPLRNRIIAALSEVLVVVESRESGGSLITARLALDMGVEVMVVPGSTHSRASAGTNQLMFDGAGIARSADDVLGLLGLDHSRQHSVVGDHRRMPSGVQAAVLEACGERPSTLDMIVAATGCSVIEVALAAARLEQSGWLLEAGGWFEPATSRLE